jgi:type III pantothenate kinase
MAESFLIFDVGNTRTACALVTDGAIRRFLPGCGPRFSRLKPLLDSLQKNHGRPAVVIGSVAPGPDRQLVRFLCGRYRCRIWRIPNPPVVSQPLPYQKNRLGLDRIADVEAVRILGRLPCLVVDAGTVTTLDAVGGRGEYKGGVLVPGLAAGFEALRRSAAGLRMVHPRPAGPLFGQSTREGAAAGIWYGTAALIRFCRDELQRQFRRPVYCRLTGGNAAALARLVPGPGVAVDPSLTLRGYLRLAALNHCPFLAAK